MSEKTDTAAIPIGAELQAEVPVLSPLDQIRQRRSRITSGAWQWVLKHGHPVFLIAEHGTYEERILEVFDEGELLIQDADFIASAPADIDTLLSLLEESYRALRGDYDLLSECLEQVQRYRVGVPA